ncbi:MAG: hypothetical protein H6R04_889 [Burkholderiaceae bacterium]|nr:hypothetical protein [Burkholderiaceae bacterium]
MISFRHKLFPLLAVFVSGLCHAGGSVAFEDVASLLRAQPVTQQWLTSTLVLPETADAEIRFGNQFVHLGGARMGPYTFRAKVKGVAKPAEIDVTVCTVATFLDKSGRKVTKSVEKTATKVEEKLTVVLVRDARDDAAAVCPAE